MRIGRMRVIPLSRGNVAKRQKGCRPATDLPQGNTQRPVAFGESPHPSRRLCCYAKRNHSAIRQPSFKGTSALRRRDTFPTRGKAFFFRSVWFIAVVTALAAVISPQGGERAAASTTPTFLATFLPHIGGSFDYFATQNFASRTAQDDSGRQRLYTNVSAKSSSL